MKIAFLHMTMGLANRGSEVVIDSLAQNLAQKHQVIMIQSGPITPKSYQVVRIYPLDTAPIPAPINILDKLRVRLHLDDNSGKVADFTRASINKLRNLKPDIIIAVNGSLQLRTLKFYQINAKMVTFGHAGIGHDDRSVLKTSPNLFIALTRQAETWARKYQTGRTKIVYIPNPIDLNLFSKAKPHALSLTQPIILTVGAFSKYKNIDQVVIATKSLNASLLMIGDGEESSKISNLLKNFPTDFSWIKYLNHDELPRYYASANIFCFIPDRQESFGMVYLEAMATGLPIVASDDPIRRNLIGDKGIYVDPHNIESIKVGIHKASQLGKIDYSAELKQFELKNVVKQIETQFYELLK